MIDLGALRLDRALVRARAYAPEEYARVAALSRAADARVLAARTLEGVAMGPARCRLLADAALLRARAAGGSVLVLARSALDDRGMMVVLDALAARNPAYFDELSTELLLQLEDSLARAERALRHRSEPRSLSALRLLRASRTMVLGLGLCAVVWLLVSTATAPPNVAFHKRVTAHGMFASTASPATLVDGETDTTYGPVILRGSDASFTIDLGGPYDLSQVRVFNRRDRSFDACLPLDIETSLDGSTWEVRERRRDHFTIFSVEMHHTRAQYVRVRTEGSELGLVEIEVDGRYGK